MLVVVALVGVSAAAGPTVSKRVLGEAEGAAVLVIQVTATEGSIFGVTIEDASGSMFDVVAPNGWVGITSGGKTLFRTDEKPIRAGSRLAFRVLTTNKDAGLTVSFQDAESVVGVAQTI
jgi:hypothetical protein